MGTSAHDIWTFMHFIFGFISTLAFIPSKPWSSVLVTNLIHLAMEIAELSVCDNGVILESSFNHLADTVWFFIGSLLSIPFMPFIKDRIWVRGILLLISLIAFIEQVTREIFPKKWQERACNYKTNFPKTHKKMIRKGKNPKR